MRKFTLFLLSLFVMTMTMAQTYKPTDKRYSSLELNSMTETTLIAIKNVSQTNEYWMAGTSNVESFSNDVVFAWVPVTEGETGSYYLKKLDGDYLQNTKPITMGTIDTAQKFSTVNATQSGSDNAYFNGDNGDGAAGDNSDETLLVRFLISETEWLNCQTVSGTPTYNSGKGGYTIHNVYAVEETNEETEIAPTIVSTLSAFNPNKCYTVSTTTRGGWAVNEGTDGYRFCSTNDAGNGTTVDANNTAHQFAVLTTDSTSYYLYSVAAQKFVKADLTLVASVADAIEFADASSVGVGRVRVNFRDVANSYINIGGSNQMEVNSWSTVDEGNAVAFVEAGDFDPATALEMLSNVVEVTYNFLYNGDTLATQTTTVTKGDAYPAFTNIPFGFTAMLPEGTISTDATVGIELTFAGYPFEYAESVETIEHWYNLQMHSNNKKYIQYVEGVADIEWEDTEITSGEENSYAWAFVGNPAIGFKLVNNAAGLSKALVSDGNSSSMGDFASGTLWLPVASAVSGEGCFCMQYPGGNYLNAQGGKVAFWSANDAGSTFVATECVIATPAAPLAQTAVFDFVTNEWGIPTIEESNYEGVKSATILTDGVNTIEIDPTANSGNFYYEGCLRIANIGTTITLPAFNFDVAKIEIVGDVKGASYSNADMNVFVNGTAVSTACKGSTGTNVFEIAENAQAAGNVYELTIGEAGGKYSSVIYISYIKVYPKVGVKAPEFDVESGVYTQPFIVNVSSPTVELEGVTNAIYYYTINGGIPTAEDEETETGRIEITKTCTVNVVVEFTYNGVTYTSEATSAEYIISEAVTYNRATAVEAGAYFIAANGYVATLIKDSKLPALETTVDGNRLTEAVYYAITLEEAEGGYHIKDVNGNYIYTTAMYEVGKSGPKLYSTTYAPGNNAWTIEIENSGDEETGTSVATISSSGIVLVYDTEENAFVVYPASEVPETAVKPTFYGTHPTGISDVLVDGNGKNDTESIYDLSGRKLEKVSVPGIYIVNGNKVLVK